MTKTIIDKAKKKAQQSICKHRVSATGFDKSGNVLGSAINRPHLSKIGGGIHAEISLLRRIDVKKLHSILLCRVGKGGNLLPIHPCENCKKVLDKLGVFVYSVGND